MIRVKFCSKHGLHSDFRFGSKRERCRRCHNRWAKDYVNRNPERRRQQSIDSARCARAKKPKVISRVERILTTGKGNCRKHGIHEEWYLFTRKNQQRSSCKKCKREKASLPSVKQQKKIKAKIWYEKTKPERQAYSKKYREQNKETLRVRNQMYRRNREKLDPVFRLTRRLRKRMWDAIVNKRTTSIDLVGCTWEQLTTHLEALFEPGMTWENYGTGWHVDHRIPLSAVDTLTEREELCHYSNLQPLWAADNIRKGAKW